MELSDRPVRLHVAYSWLPKRQVCSSFVYLVEQNIAWVYTDTAGHDISCSATAISTDCRPLYRPLCRPISQSTLPTVNKIQKPAKEGLSRYRLCTRILTTLLNFVLLLQLNESGKAHLFIRPSLAFFIF